VFPEEKLPPRRIFTGKNLTPGDLIPKMSPLYNNRTKQTHIAFPSDQYASPALLTLLYHENIAPVDFSQWIHFYVTPAGRWLK